jgi:predicted phosphodiesterase
MSTLRIVSDLHLEFGPYFLPKMEGEKDQILILAGDICLAQKFEVYDYFFEDVSDRFKYVIYIPGNHEYYHGSIERTPIVISKGLEKYQNVVARSSFNSRLDGLEFGCATLWTDFNGGNPLNMLAAQRGMSDFKVIRHKGLPLTPEAIFRMHERQLKVLTRKPVDVIVSHHAPSYQSVAQQYLFDSLTPAFANKLDMLIEELPAKVWVHGHTHSFFDYAIGSTRVVCNPRGYPDEKNGFNPFFTVEV